MKKLVKVIEPQTDQVLFECEVQDIDKAYAYATKMDEMGIDAKIIAPSLPETLALSLGMSAENIEKLKQAMNDEIESHLPDGCIVCEDVTKEIQ